MNYRDTILSVTDSTNRVARQQAGLGVPHGSGVLAAQQTAGRGRLGRVWHSPPEGNLYCSFVVRPKLDLGDFPKLTMVAGLATAEYLIDCTSLAIRLKWPNDLYIGRRKCGGILCESVFDESNSGARYAVIGIGINLNLKAEQLPASLANIATSLVIEGADPLDPLVVFNGIRTVLLARIDLFENIGFQPILDKWRAYDMLRGTTMEWVTPDGRKVVGKSLGPDDDGLLRVEDERGERHLVLSGDISLQATSG